ncbi:MAG TPA: arginine deiminase family protein [Gaiellaceae bacterium]|nr:arginine deiminase family protein [Gaiellaceae bacterium]
MSIGGFGGPNAVAKLERVLVRAPRPEDAASWRAYGWRAEPDPVRMAEEHEAFCEELAAAGAQVVTARAALPPCPDAIYVHDPALVARDGAILLRPGKEERRIEVDAIGADLEAAGVPVASRLHAPGTAEGGDTLWLDDSTLLVGRGYRTNDAGIRALADALPGVDVVAFDLPHLRGAAEVLHLLSLLSPLDVDLVVAYLPLLPVRLVELLRAREIEIVEVPDDEFESMGANVLALAPRVALALDGNPETRRRMESAGVDVRIYSGDEISRKGDGGPTCLTRPLLRA